MIEEVVGRGNKLDPEQFRQEGRVNEGGDDDRLPPR